MILTTKARYAVMAVIDLFDENYGQEQLKPITLLSISQRQKISLSYLEQIFANLRKADIVKSLRGPGGGYVLKKTPKEIKIGTIISAIGENINMTACKNGKEGCALVKKDVKAKCRTHHLWQGLEENIHDYLNSISLVDICKK